ncbi:MAG: hypothetical protein HC774_00960 [Sphingomonadales bacterium]|nr:hypothetical protein [Sphingomonadales bacterium]
MATGGTLAVFVLRAFGDLPNGVAEMSIVFNLLAAILKYAYWRGIDTEVRTHTAGDATGLGRFGAVRVLDQPHTQANFESAFYRSPITDNNSFEQWEAEGSKDLAQRANALYKRQLAEYVAPPMDPAVDEAILDYVNRRKSSFADSNI